MNIPLIYPVFKPFTEFSRDIFSYLFLCRTPPATLGFEKKNDKSFGQNLAESFFGPNPFSQNKENPIRALENSIGTSLQNLIGMPPINTRETSMRFAGSPAQVLEGTYSAAKDWFRSNAKKAGTTPNYTPPPEPADEPPAEFINDAIKNGLAKDERGARLLWKGQKK